MNEFLKQRKKKDDYKNLLDMQNKYLSSLKKNKRKLKEENNMAERMMLNNQYQQENGNFLYNSFF